MNRNPMASRRSAYSLIEVIIAMSLLAIGMGVIANLTLTYTQSVRISGRMAHARALAAGLMAEVLSRSHTGSPQAAGGASRLARDHTLQFDGWESPLCDIPGFGESAVYPIHPHVAPGSCGRSSDVLSAELRDYRRLVEVVCIHPSSLMPADCNLPDADALLQVTVTVQYDGRWMCDMVAYKGKAPLDSGS